MQNIVILDIVLLEVLLCCDWHVNIMVKRITLVFCFLVFCFTFLFLGSVNAQELKTLSKPLQSKVEENLELANRYTAAGNNRQVGH